MLNTHAGWSENRRLSSKIRVLLWPTDGKTCNRSIPCPFRWPWVILRRRRRGVQFFRRMHNTLVPYRQGNSKSNRFGLWITSNHSIKFHRDFISSFFSNPANRQTDRHGWTHNLLAPIRDSTRRVAYRWKRVARNVRCLVAVPVHHLTAPGLVVNPGTLVHLSLVLVEELARAVLDAVAPRTLVSVPVRLITKRNNTTLAYRLFALDKPGRPVPECLHSGLYCSEVRWRWWMVTTGAIRRAKLQSNCRHQQTITGRMPFLSPNQQRQTTEGVPSATHTNSVLTVIFPGEPGLAGFHLHSSSPLIPGLCILLVQA